MKDVSCRKMDETGGNHTERKSQVLVELGRFDEKVFFPCFHHTSKAGEVYPTATTTKTIKQQPFFSDQWSLTLSLFLLDMKPVTVITRKLSGVSIFGELQKIQASQMWWSAQCTHQHIHPDSTDRA